MRDKLLHKSDKQLPNEDYSADADISRFKSLLEHVLLKLDFSVSIDIYMLPRNVNLRGEKTVGYNNNILIKQNRHGNWQKWKLKQS